MILQDINDSQLNYKLNLGENMLDSAATAEPPDVSAESVRAVLAMRLAELAAWPESRILPPERQLVGDVVLRLMRTADPKARRKCAEGVSRLVDAPNGLLRYLACDEIDVAQVILLDSTALTDLDQLEVIRTGTAAHWRTLARRRGLAACVTDALVSTQDTDTVLAILANPEAELAATTLDSLAALASREPRLIPPVLERPELKPTQGFSIFWSANAEGRLRVLRRFAVDRNVLTSELSDLFVRAKAEKWLDPMSLHALGFLERRQRSRPEVEGATLEGFIMALGGVLRMEDEELAALAAMCGITPATLERILLDHGGEPFAVLAKAVGLRRDPTVRLWRAIGGVIGDREDRTRPFGRMAFVYDTLSNAKAQTVLRYWNWATNAHTLGAG